MTTLIKLGGSLLESDTLRHSALTAIATAWSAGRNLVLVHGGGKTIDLLASRVGIERRTVEGLRVTDAKTLEVVTSALAGVVNKKLVGDLQAASIPAVGVTGVDGATLTARIHPPVGGVDLGFVGEMTSADGRLVSALSSNGFLPVIGSLALGPDGCLLNVNADSAAAALAVALGCDRLVFLTDVEGFLDPEGNVVTSLTAAEVTDLLHAKKVSGGMSPKLHACVSALAGGVKEVLIAGPGRHRSALLEGEGGTRLVAA